MDEVESKEDFMVRVKYHVKKCFEEDPGDHETWQDLYIWVVAYFMSEDMADMSTKDMARFLVAGSPAITIESAEEYIEQQYEGCEVEDPKEMAEMIDDLFRRFLDFMHE